MARWTIVISDNTDKALRMFLAQAGGRKGDLSAFVEKAVRNQLARRIREDEARKNARGPADEAELLQAFAQMLGK